MNRLRALIADDEPLARMRLRRLLRSDGRVDVVAECANGLEAIAAIRDLKPDVAFLDIQMPDADGFSVLARTREVHGPRIVFVTAYAEHALRAFDVQATGYLLKPLSPQRLRATLKRLCSEINDTRRVDPESTQRYPLRMTVPAGSRVRVLNVAEIDCIQARANYIAVHVGENQYVVRQTLAGIEARLDPDVFVRTHRSHIIRIDAVMDFELLESGQLLLRLSNGMRIATGRSYRDHLRAVLAFS